MKVVENPTGSSFGAGGADGAEPRVCQGYSRFVKVTAVVLGCLAEAKWQNLDSRSKRSENWKKG